MLRPIREQYLSWPGLIFESFSDALDAIEKPLLSSEYRSLVGCGMGGSGFSLLAVKPIVEALLPYIVERSERLPPHVGASDAVVAVSYSGETLETISCFTSSTGRASGRGVVAGRNSTLSLKGRKSGSIVAEIERIGHPRSSLAQLVGALLAVLLGEKAREEIRETARTLDSSRALEDAEKISSILYNNGEMREPIIVSCGPLGFIAERWATEFSENAKYPVFYEVYPEAGHNFIARWYYTRGNYQLIYVDMSSEGLCEKARKYVLSHYPSVADPILLDYTVYVEKSPLGGLLQSAMTAGLVSVLLAERLGRDPEVIEAIDEYKRMVKGR